MLLNRVAEPSLETMCGFLAEMPILILEKHVFGEHYHCLFYWLCLYLSLGYYKAASSYLFVHLPALPRAREIVQGISKVRCLLLVQLNLILYTPHSPESSRIDP